MRAAPPPPVLSGVSVNPASVVGGNSSTGTVTLSAAQSGATVVALSTPAPASVATMPASVTVPAGALSASFTINTSPVAETFNMNVFADLAGSPGRQALLLITPGAAPAATLAAVSLNPTSVVGGNPSTGTVTLSAAAPSGGAVVSLSGNSTAAPVPASITVPAGAASASFTVTTSAVTAPTSATISAVFAGVTRTAALSINPAGSTGSTGLRSPTANGAESGGDGNGYQANPANAHSLDGLFAVDADSGSGTSTSCTSSSKDKHRFYNFGLAIPGGSAIKGITVRLDAKVDSTSGSPRICVQLSWNGGSSWTSARSTPALETSVRAFTLGSSTDAWGRTWNVNDLSDSNFRLRVIDVASSTSRDFSLDRVAVEVSY